MKLDDVKKLHQKKYRTQFGYYLVEGEHLILELDKALAQSKVINANDCTLYVSEAHESWAKNLQNEFSVMIVSDKQMAKLSDTKTPQGMLARIPLKPMNANASLKNGRYIYLHEVQDPGNLGTILRSMAWFGNFTLLLSPNSVDPFNSKVVRSSMGAIFHVPIELDVSLASLEARFRRFAYLDMQGSDIASNEFTQFDCYLFGNEARGVPSETLKDLRATPFTITGSGQIDSLNLASAVTISSYQLSR